MDATPGRGSAYRSLILLESSNSNLLKQQSKQYQQLISIGLTLSYRKMVSRRLKYVHLFVGLVKDLLVPIDSLILDTSLL